MLLVWQVVSELISGQAMIFAISGPRAARAQCPAVPRALQVTRNAACPNSRALSPDRAVSPQLQGWRLPSVQRQPSQPWRPRQRRTRIPAQPSPTPVASRPMSCRSGSRRFRWSPSARAAAMAPDRAGSPVVWAATAPRYLPLSRFHLVRRCTSRSARAAPSALLTPAPSCPAAARRMAAGGVAAPATSAHAASLQIRLEVVAPTDRPVRWHRGS